MYTDIIVSVILAALLIFVTLKKKAFTPAAAITAGTILIIAGICGSYAAIVIVLAAYGIVFAVDMVLGKRTEKITGEINRKTGTRDVVQVLANGLAATVALIIGKLMNSDVGIVVYAAALTECLADSLASDVGVLSKNDPIDICRMKRIKRGMSGGVSLLGTLSALCGSVIMTLIAFAFWGISAKYVIALTAIPMLGILIDSALGSLVQAKYVCTQCGKFTEKSLHCGKATRHAGGARFINNDTVNIISNFSTAAIAAIYLIFM